MMKCFLKDLCDYEVPDPKLGDFKLNVFPFNHDEKIRLPDGFAKWEPVVNFMMDFVPIQEQALRHYVTIDSKFFTTDDFLRREGVHIDGNPCVDPNFIGSTWGGATWSGTSLVDGKVYTPFASPYNEEMPIGTYVSSELGGILCVSSLAGCEAWDGNIPDNVGSGGEYTPKYLINSNHHNLEANKIYFMSSNTPHQTLEIKKGSRRTLIRITLNHKYKNHEILKKIHSKSGV